ncbi:MAG: hypothetical protein LBD82_03240 [Deltaproteobacteria bacterium]|nr:hypothetical protein [Deltaproteobacteria bacterium]
MAANDAEKVMSMVWSKIIGEVRRMREEKYTLERIGLTLGVSKPTVQRWLEGEAGGEKTAFIDIIRYTNALKLNLGGIIDDTAASPAPSLSKNTKNGENTLRAENTRLSADLLEAQRELLQAKSKLIEAQDKMLQLEKEKAELSANARRGGAVSFPDLPPIHLHRR